MRLTVGSLDNHPTAVGEAAALELSSNDSVESLLEAAVGGIHIFVGHGDVGLIAEADIRELDEAAASESKLKILVSNVAGTGIAEEALRVEVLALHCSVFAKVRERHPTLGVGVGSHGCIVRTAEHPLLDEATAVVVVGCGEVIAPHIDSFGSFHDGIDICACVATILGAGDGRAVRVLVEQLFHAFVAGIAVALAADVGERHLGGYCCCHCKGSEQRK